MERTPAIPRNDNRARADREGERPDAVCRIRRIDVIAVDIDDCGGVGLDACDSAGLPEHDPQGVTGSHRRRVAVVCHDRRWGEFQRSRDRVFDMIVDRIRAVVEPDRVERRGMRQGQMRA